jgi:glycosyltransferase involved in cell wall biosynthesis
MDFKEFKAKFQKVPVDLFPNQVPNNPLVSVCIQTYQHANYIKECLDGILMQQTNFPFEILLGEDESTDGTREICMEYAKKYPNKIRLFLHHRENNIKINGNATGRFNFLYNIYTSKGKYIALCEGDDYWTDILKLQKQFDLIQETNDYKLVGHKTREVSEINTVTNFGFIKQRTGKLYFKDVLKSEYPMHTSSFFFEKSSLLPIPLWLTKTFCADIPIIHLLALNHPIFIIDEFMSVYRHNSFSVTKQLKKPPSNSMNISVLYFFDGINLLSNKKYNYLIKKAAFIHYAKKIKWYSKKRILSVKFVIQEGYDLIKFILK